MSTKFGDKIEFTVSPGLILAIEAELTSWVLHLSQLGNIDLERESMAKAQTLVGFIKEFGRGGESITPAIAGPTTAVKKISQLKAGDKFWFNNGNRGEMWVLDQIENDERFPTEKDPHQVWKIFYHLDVPYAIQHFLHIDERDTAVVIV